MAFQQTFGGMNGSVLMAMQHAFFRTYFNQLSSLVSAIRLLANRDAIFSTLGRNRDGLFCSFFSADEKANNKIYRDPSPGVPLQQRFCVQYFFSLQPQNSLEGLDASLGRLREDDEAKK